MITAILLILVILITLGLAVSAIKKNKSSAPSLRPFVPAAVTLVVGLIITFFQPYSVERIDAGHIGIKVNLTGDQRGVSSYEYKTGWVVYNVWSANVVEIATYQQHIEYDTIHVTTKGGFMTDINPSFNYSVIPTAAGDMYQSLRKSLPEIEQGWLKNAIFSSVNDVANRWTVDSIFNAREQFEAAIITECNKRVSQWFVVSQLRSNIVPPPALQDAIGKKTKAIQDVQVAENNKRVAIAVAETNVATAEGNARAQIAKAKGDSAQAVITAAGDAAAIRLKQMTITPLYIEYIRAANWDGKLPTTTLGNSGTFFNLK